MTDAHGGDSPWPRILGPVFNAESLARELGLSFAEIDKAVEARQLLQLTTSEGFDVYPSFQVSSGAVVDGLQQVLVALGDHVDSLTCAQFLNTPLGTPPRRHIERLQAGEVEYVVREAERLAVSLSE